MRIRVGLCFFFFFFFLLFSITVYRIFYFCLLLRFAIICIFWVLYSMIFMLSCSVKQIPLKPSAIILQLSSDTDPVETSQVFS